MAFTYAGDPANSTLEEVRFLVGDTVTPGQLTDAEINYCIADEPTSIYRAAACSARAIAATYARKADREIGDLEIKWSQLQKHYSQLAKDLEKRATAGVGGIVATGTSIAAKKSADLDTDRVIPAFRKEEFDNRAISLSHTDPTSS